MLEGLRNSPPEETRKEPDRESAWGQDEEEGLCLPGNHWLRGCLYCSSECLSMCLIDDLLLCVLPPSPSTSTAWVQRGGLGAYRGGRWLWLCQEQVWPCSPATLPAQAWPCMALMWAGQGRAWQPAEPVMGLARLGSHQHEGWRPGGPAPKCCSLEMFAQQFIWLGSTRSCCLPAASPAGCLLGPGFRQMHHW